MKNRFENTFREDDAKQDLFGKPKVNKGKKLLDSKLNDYGMDEVMVLRDINSGKRYIKLVNTGYGTKAVVVRDIRDATVSDAGYLSNQMLFIDNEVEGKFSEQSVGTIPLDKWEELFPDDGGDYVTYSDIESHLDKSKLNDSSDEYEEEIKLTFSLIKWYDEDEDEEVEIPIPVNPIGMYEDEIEYDVEDYLIKAVKDEGFDLEAEVYPIEWKAEGDNGKSYHWKDRGRGDFDFTVTDTKKKANDSNAGSALDNWLQDVAQMTGEITYNDIKEVNQTNIKEIRKLRREWSELLKEDPEAEDELFDIGKRVKKALNTKLNDSSDGLVEYKGRKRKALDNDKVDEGILEQLLEAGKTFYRIAEEVRDTENLANTFSDEGLKNLIKVSDQVFDLDVDIEHALFNAKTENGK